MIGTPKSLRLQIALVGRVNSGKSSFLNLVSGQQVAIVSSQRGTTTDVVEKAQELIPLGPVLWLDTAGTDDDSALGEARWRRTLQAVDRADVMLIVTFFLVSYIVGWYVKRDRQLISTLQESVNRDALTGLFNHRYFHQYMHSLVAVPHAEPQFLFLADIDFFKVYNDTLGHPKGDQVLKQIAGLSKTDAAKVVGL